MELAKLCRKREISAKLKEESNPNKCSNCGSENAIVILGECKACREYKKRNDGKVREGWYRAGVFICTKSCGHHLSSKKVKSENLRNLIDKSRCQSKENGKCRVCRESAKVYFKEDEMIERCEYCYNHYAVYGRDRYLSLFVKNLDNEDVVKECLNRNCEFKSKKRRDFTFVKSYCVYLCQGCYRHHGKEGTLRSKKECDEYFNTIRRTTSTKTDTISTNFTSMQTHLNCKAF